MERLIEAVSYEEDIIQLRLTNVPKHPIVIAKIFTILSECDVNIDMISLFPLRRKLPHFYLVCIF